MTDLDDDFVEVWAAPDDASDTARALLDAADKHDLPVESVESLGGGGFRVPKAVADAAALPKGTDVEKDVDEMTVDELRAHAEKNGVDLGDATKKADILAAVKAGTGE